MPQGIEPGEGGGPLQFFLKRSVRDELRLTQVQQDQVREAVQAVRVRFRGEMKQLLDPGQEGPPEQRQEMKGKLVQEVLRLLAGILDPDQLKRLRELEIQASGPQAFADPAVQVALELTEEQKRLIRNLTEAGRQEIQGRFRRVESEGGHVDWQEIGAQKRQTLNKLVALLTDKQQAVWREMTGAPFEAR